MTAHKVRCLPTKVKDAFGLGRMSYGKNKSKEKVDVNL